MDRPKTSRLTVRRMTWRELRSEGALTRSFYACWLGYLTGQSWVRVI